MVELGCPDRMFSCAAFLSPPTTLRRWRALGDLAVGTRIRALLPLAWLSEGAFTHTPVATHVPPSKPGVTRFYARHIFGEHNGGLFPMLGLRAGANSKPPLSVAPLSNAPHQTRPSCGDTQPQPEIAAEALRGGSSGVADARRNGGEGSGCLVGYWLREPSCVHRIPPGRSPGGAPAPEGSCPVQECGAGWVGIELPSHGGAARELRTSRSRRQIARRRFGRGRLPTKGMRCRTNLGDQDFSR